MLNKHDNTEVSQVSTYILWVQTKLTYGLLHIYKSQVKTHRF